VAGRCFLWKSFGPPDKIQTEMRGARVFWWLSCAAGVESKCIGFDAGTLERLLTVLDRA
jgi:hypothetical protein